MVETGLTRELIDAGAKLVEKLDERGLAPDAAFWLYSPEEEAWKLLLVEVKLAKKGPKVAILTFRRYWLKTERNSATYDWMIWF